jgi:glycine/sarcosine N-methyltransferase
MDEDADVGAFYDDLAPDYHLLFPDWSAAIAAQAAVLEGLIGAAGAAVLDCACGIGTQAIGLAARGHRVVAGDVSPVGARRCAAEAAARNLVLPAVAADMRHLPFPSAAFDVVVCIDNAIAHLLEPVQLGYALREMRRVLRRDGLLIIGTRSDALRRTHPTTSPPQVHHTADRRPGIAHSESGPGRPQRREGDAAIRGLVRAQAGTVVGTPPEPAQLE